jgi:hypothetical protein
MKCTICHHPHRRAIDLALLSRHHTLESLHSQFGVSVSALFRHRKHMKENVMDARDRLEKTRRQGCLLKLTGLLAHVQQAIHTAIHTAEADGHLDRVIRGAYVASRIIQQIDRLEVSLELDTVYRLISASGFVSQDTLLPTDPQVIAELHQAVVDTACAPCPEPPPALAAEAGGEDAPDAGHGRAPANDQPPVEPLAETRNSPLKNPPSERAVEIEALRLIQRLYPDVDLSAAGLAAAGKDPENKRKITEKLPKKIALVIENMLQDQKVTQG